MYTANGPINNANDKGTYLSTYIKSLNLVAPN